ncbi:MAG: malate dehydrogenase, partial [Planctomycetota bacterium]|nr:malate dehydrogenase [Planctomycetota bacterium]
MSKVSVIGAGHVGESVAFMAAERHLADVVLIDIVEGMPQGKALDMSQVGPLFGFDSAVRGSNDMKDVAGSDVVVVTAGIPRKPGMDRMELLGTNAGIVKGLCEAIRDHAPDAIVILVTNPLDVMAHVALETTGFVRGRVMGMAGVLDAARFRTFIASELGVSVKDIAAMVLGGHGDQMVPLPRFSTVNGVPLPELMPTDRIEALVERTRKGGAEIVALLKTGSAYYAPGASVTVMLEAILRDTGHLLPVAAALDGEYGYSGIFLGVPVVLGREGIRSIEVLDLTEDERAALQRSADAVRAGVESVSQFL